VSYLPVVCVCQSMRDKFEKETDVDKKDMMQKMFDRFTAAFTAAETTRHSVGDSITQENVKRVRSCAPTSSD